MFAHEGEGEHMNNYNCSECVWKASQCFVLICFCWIGYIFTYIRSASVFYFHSLKCILWSHPNVLFQLNAFFPLVNLQYIYYVLCGNPTYPKTVFRIYLKLKKSVYCCSYLYIYKIHERRGGCKIGRKTKNHLPVQWAESFGSLQSSPNIYVAGATPVSTIRNDHYLFR